MFAALLWFAVCLGPSAVAAQITGLASDRYGFLALLSIPLLAAALVPLWQRAPAVGRATWIGAVAFWGLALFVLTQLQMGAFQDSRALYMNAVSMEPESAAAWYGLGIVMVTEQGCEQAEPLFARALSLDPDHVRALNNAGVCALRRQAFLEAEQYFRRVLVLTKGVHPRAWSNLAQIHLQQGKQAEACEELRKSLSINPHGRGVRELLGRHCP